MILRLSVTCFFLFAVSHAMAQSTSLPTYFEHYPLKSSGRQVFDIAQDSRGVMYFATSGGVLEYDGVSWNTIEVKNRVTYSLNSSGDSVFYGGFDDFGMLYRDGIGSRKKMSLAEEGGHSETIGQVWKINVSANFVFFLLFNGYIEYNRATAEVRFQRYADALSIVGQFVHQGNTIVILDGGVMQQLSGLTGERKILGKVLDELDLVFPGFLSSGDRIILASGYDGLFKLDLKQKRYVKFPIEDEAFFLNSALQSVRQLSSDTWILNSYSNGAIIIDSKGNLLKRFGKQTGLPTNCILAARRSNEGKLWLGTNKGILKVDETDVMAFWPNDELIDGDVYDVLSTRDGIYAATDQHLFRLDKDFKLHEIKSSHPISQRWQMTEFKTGNRSKVILASNAGIFEATNDGLVQIYESEEPVYCVLQSSAIPNRLIFGDQPGLGSLIYRNGVWEFEGFWKGTNLGEIRHVVEGSDGSIWAGTFGQVLFKVVSDTGDILKPLSIRQYGASDGIHQPFRVIPAAYKDNILALTEGGILILDEVKDRFIPFCALDKRFCDSTNSFNQFGEDQFRRTFVSSRNGLIFGYFIMESNNLVWHEREFRTLPKSRIFKVTTDSLKRIWIASEDGLIMFNDGAHHAAHDHNFDCLITGATCYDPKANNDALTGQPLGAFSEAKGGSNRIKFQYAAPFFEKESQTRYRYRLEPLQSHWSDWSAKSEKEFVNLWEGDYTFEVQAMNVYGTVSSTAHFSFHVSPPWYRTVTAGMAFIVLFVALIYVILNAATGRLRKQKYLLIQTVRSSTDELRLQKLEIEKQAESLGELNRTKDMVFAVIGHDLRAPINSLLALIDLYTQRRISTDEFSYFSEKAVKSLRVIQVTLNNLLLWARSQMDGLKAYEQVFNLYSLVEESARLVSEVSEEKNVAIRIDMPRGVAVFADRDQIGIVVRNLILNSIKYTSGGGSIRVSATLAGQRCYVSVEDTGVGMTKELIDKILSKRIQKSSPGTLGERGTGLGLFMAIRMIELNEGEVSIASSVGHGTRVSFDLRLAPEPESP